MNIDALAIAASSMAGDIDRMAVISHNLANAGTAGFKRGMAVSRPFVAMLDAQLAYGGAAPQPLQAWTNHAVGPMQNTGHALDLAIDGDGFFEVEDANGPVYTRTGQFQLDANGRLVDAAGRAVAGSGGEIRLESPQPRIDRQGRVYDGDVLAGQLRVVRFDEPQSLVKLGAGQFAAGAQSAQAVADPAVRQGYLEASNVVAANEMVRLIETMRHFESGQKVIQGCDEVLERAIRTLGEF